MRRQRAGATAGGGPGRGPIPASQLGVVSGQRLGQRGLRRGGNLASRGGLGPGRGDVGFEVGALRLPGEAFGRQLLAGPNGLLGGRRRFLLCGQNLLGGFGVRTTASAPARARR